MSGWRAYSCGPWSLARPDSKRDVYAVSPDCLGMRFVGRWFGAGIPINRRRCWSFPKVRDGGIFYYLMKPVKNEKARRDSGGEPSET